VLHPEFGERIVPSDLPLGAADQLQQDGQTIREQHERHPAALRHCLLQFQGSGQFQGHLESKYGKVKAEFFINYPAQELMNPDTLLLF
jgi:hypothetical protein